MPAILDSGPIFMMLDSWSRRSRTVKMPSANALIRHDASYDAARLSPDALRQLFLHLVREELRSEAAANANASPNPNTNANPALSPNSRKRKAQSPPLPSLKEVIDNFGKIPVLVEKLYARYREQTVRAIREDERRAVALQREIHALEQAEREEEKARLDAKRLPAAAQAQTATPVPAPSPTPTPTPDLQRPPQPPKGPSPVPATAPHNAPSPGPVAIQPAVPTPSPVPVQAKPSPGPHQQHQIPSRNVAPPSGPSPPPPPPPPPTAVPQAQTPSLTPQGKAQQPFKPTAPPSQVLQPPMGASQPPPRNLQSTTPVPLPAISPRPDAAKPKTPGPAAAVPVPIPQPGTPSTLKWEKPYQPPGPAAPLQGRPTQPQPLATNAPLPTHLKRTLRLKLLFKPEPRLHITPMYKYHDHSSHLYSISSRYSFPHKLEPIAAPQRPPSTTPVPSPAVPQARPASAQPQQPPTQAATGYVPPQNRPIAAAPAPAALTPATQQQTLVPPPGWVVQPPAQQTQQQPGHTPQHVQQQFRPSPTPSHPQNQPGTVQKRVSSPYTNQPPKPAIPAHLAGQLPASPSPAQRIPSSFVPPKTPVASSPSFIMTGSGTRWTAKSTPSTPRPPAQGRPSGDIPSPAFEPLSPVLASDNLPAPTPSQAPPSQQATPKAEPKLKPKQEPLPKSVESVPKEPKETKEGKPKRGRPSRNAQRDSAQETPSRIVARSQSVASQADELSMDDHELAPRVKNEEATPRPPDEAGDTTADESGPSRRHAVTPSSVSSRLAHKRKRQESPVELPPQPASTPTHVLWTRQFGKISNPALDQISSHRCANQFAHAIRERDAPGYKGLILQPQDIKSIRAAMTHGNRAAVEAAKKLPDGDPGTPTLWLPISSDLLPPKSIINSEQLERELVHMFSNAIMYNLDPYRGPGNSFMKREASVDGEGDAEPSTYRVDEDAVVRDSRIMFVEVERLLGDLRAAERDRSGLPPSGSGSARPTSVAATPRGESTPAAQTADDDMDELAGDENTGSTYKRRRIGTRDAGSRA
ncbi:Bromodomain-containing protein 1 like [Verticillium longisporum]|nr:Bromodomain-containing protein 1 like [Verticillium longisporum]